MHLPICMYPYALFLGRACMRVFAGGKASAVRNKCSKQVPTCIIALCDIPPHAFLRYATFPHVHYATSPHMHSCVILADCAKDSVQHGAQLHIDSHICRPAKDSVSNRCQTSSFNTPSALLGVTLGEPAWYGGRRWQMVLQCVRFHQLCDGP